MHTNQLSRYTVEGVGRIYSNGEDIWLPSVSTVLDVRETPEALRRWKKRTDDYEEIMWYKQNRGTLIHETCLQQVAPDGPDGEPVIKLWGDDETQSAMELWYGGSYERYLENEEWAHTVWDYIKIITGLDDDGDSRVLDSETYVFNTDIGYAGQFDLLYYDEDEDDVVLADLKTSKSTYEKHQLQLSAYAMAVDVAVDRLEVLRLSPDLRDWEVFPDDEWELDREDLETEFIRLKGQLESEKLSTLVETIKDADASDEGVLYEEM